MKTFVITILLVLIGSYPININGFIFENELKFEETDPDQDRTLIELIESRGYFVEQHSIETDDGYFLLAHRILLPNSLRNWNSKLKPVIVQHGLFGASSDFCINSPLLKNNQSKYGDTIAFALTQTRRYDVWLTNSRGNRYSMRHRTRSPTNRDFWQFSWDQMATKDLPAVIDYIRNETKSKTVAYIGYSQGTAIMFTLMSLRPEYAQIIQPFIALAPIVYLRDLESPIKIVAQLEPMLRMIGGEFLPSTGLIKSMADAFCSYQHFQSLCANVMFLFGGFDPKHMNDTRVGVYLHFTPSTTSTWDLVHWAQLVNSKKFKRFDYGSPNMNLENYNQTTAPEIPLHNIPSTAKIALYQGLNDILSTQSNVKHLKKKLSKIGIELIRDFIIKDPTWTHLDYVIGMNAGKLFIDDMIDTLDLYS